MLSDIKVPTTIFAKILGSFMMALTIANFYILYTQASIMFKEHSFESAMTFTIMLGMGMLSFGWFSVWFFYRSFNKFKK